MSGNSPASLTATATTSINSDTKGKSKLTPENNPPKPEESERCGICLYSSGNGEISRGYINCCNHYFCFVCIMEWSKVESTCPICKRHFSSIRRPPKSGVFDVERLVPVPVRNQVHYHFGNATVEPPNLYADTKCTVCHSGTDETLLLLCDLCDIACHSYCVGLSANVPECDWFCTDCAILKAEHTMNDRQDGADEQYSANKLKFSSDTSQISVCQQSSSNTTINGKDIGGTNTTNVVNTRSQSIVLSQAPVTNARTLVRCRNVHDRIRVLRSNWNNIRNGSLSFTSTTVDQSVTIEKPVIGSSSGETDSSSYLNQHSTAQGGTSNMPHGSRSHEISRAWKMMDLAMTSEHRKRSIPQTSNSPLKKIISSRDISRSPLSMAQKPSNKDLFCLMPRTPQKNYSLVNKNRHGTHLLRRRSKSSERTISTLPGVRSSKDVNFSPRRDSSNRETIISLNRHLSKSPMTTKSEVGVSCNSSTISPSLAANVLHANPQSNASPSSNKIGHLSSKGLVGKKCAKDKIVNGENGPKSEIQSLVKLNLKILTKDHKLEDDAFKQVARTATHSILAVCDSEHQKPGCQQFPSSICCHTNEIQQLRRSSLMPNSCRECFYAFVKDVVSNTLDKKRIFRNNP